MGEALGKKKWGGKGLGGDNRKLGLMAGVIVGIAFCVVTLQKNHNQERVNEAARLVENINTVFNEFRTVYTWHFTRNHWDTGDQLSPVPAALTMEIAKRLSSRSNLSVALYSPYPFPRRKGGGLKDDFSKAAWKELRENPGKAYYRVQETPRGDFLRFATADILTKNCITCHNNHPNTPRRDWKVGDVRGVLEVAVPIEVSAAGYLGGGNTPFYVLAGFVLFAICFIGLISSHQSDSDSLASRIEGMERDQNVQRERVSKILEVAPGALAFVSNEGRFVEWNKELETMFGREDFESLKLHELINDNDPLKELLATGFSQRMTRKTMNFKGVCVRSPGTEFMGALTLKSIDRLLEEEAVHILLIEDVSQEDPEQDLPTSESNI